MKLKCELLKRDYSIAGLDSALYSVNVSPLAAHLPDILAADPSILSPVLVDAIEAAARGTLSVPATERLVQYIDYLSDSRHSLPSNPSTASLLYSLLPVISKQLFASTHPSLTSGSSSESLHFINTLTFALLHAMGDTLSSTQAQQASLLLPLSSVSSAAPVPLTLAPLPFTWSTHASVMIPALRLLSTLMHAHTNIHSVSILQEENSRFSSNSATLPSTLSSSSSPQSLSTSSTSVCSFHPLLPLPMASYTFSTILTSPYTETTLARAAADVCFVMLMQRAFCVAATTAPSSSSSRSSPWCSLAPLRALEREWAWLSRVAVARLHGSAGDVFAWVLVDVVEMGLGLRCGATEVQEGSVAGRVERRKRPARGRGDMPDPAGITANGAAETGTMEDMVEDVEETEETYTGACVSNVDVLSMRAKAYWQMRVDAENGSISSGIRKKYRNRTISDKIISQSSSSGKIFPLFFPDLSSLIPILRSINTYSPSVLVPITSLLTLYAFFYPNLPLDTLSSLMSPSSPYSGYDRFSTVYTATTNEGHISRNIISDIERTDTDALAVSTTTSAAVDSATTSTTAPVTATTPASASAATSSIATSSTSSVSAPTSSSMSLLSILVSLMLAQLPVDRCDANIDGPREIMRQLSIILEIFRNERSIPKYNIQYPLPKYFRPWESVFGVSGVDSCFLRRTLLQSLCKRNVADDHGLRWAPLKDKANALHTSSFSSASSTSAASSTTPALLLPPTSSSRALLYAHLHQELFRAHAHSLMNLASPGEAAEGALMESVGLQEGQEKGKKRGKEVLQEIKELTVAAAMGKGDKGYDIISTTLPDASPNACSSTLTSSSLSTSAPAVPSLTSQITSYLTPALSAPSLALPAVLAGGGLIVSLEHQRARVRAQAACLLGRIAAWVSEGHVLRTASCVSCVSCAYVSAAAYVEAQHLLWGVAVDPDEHVARAAAHALMQTGTGISSSTSPSMPLVATWPSTQTEQELALPMLAEIDERGALPALTRALMQDSLPTPPASPTAAASIASTSVASAPSSSSLPLLLPRADVDDAQWLVTRVQLVRTPNQQRASHIAHTNPASSLHVHAPFPNRLLPLQWHPLHSSRVPRPRPMLAGNCVSPLVRHWGGHSACTTLSLLLASSLPADRARAISLISGLRVLTPALFEEVLSGLLVALCRATVLVTGVAVEAVHPLAYVPYTGGIGGMDDGARDGGGPDGGRASTGSSDENISVYVGEGTSSSSSNASSTTIATAPSVLPSPCLPPPPPPSISPLTFPFRLCPYREWSGTVPVHTFQLSRQSIPLYYSLFSGSEKYLSNRSYEIPAILDAISAFATVNPDYVHAMRLKLWSEDGYHRMVRVGRTGIAGVLVSDDIVDENAKALGDKIHTANGFYYAKTLCSAVEAVIGGVPVQVCVPEYTPASYTLLHTAGMCSRNLSLCAGSGGGGTGRRNNGGESGGARDANGLAGAGRHGSDEASREVTVNAVSLDSTSTSANSSFSSSSSSSSSSSPVPTLLAPFIHNPVHRALVLLWAAALSSPLLPAALADDLHRDAPAFVHHHWRWYCRYTAAASDSTATKENYGRCTATEDVRTLCNTTVITRGSPSKNSPDTAEIPCEYAAFRMPSIPLTRQLPTSPTCLLPLPSHSPYPLSNASTASTSASPLLFFSILSHRSDVRPSLPPVASLAQWQLLSDAQLAAPALTPATISLPPATNTNTNINTNVAASNAIQTTSIATQLPAHSPSLSWREAVARDQRRTLLQRFRNRQPLTLSPTIPAGAVSTFAPASVTLTGPVPRPFFSIPLAAQAYQVHLPQTITITATTALRLRLSRAVAGCLDGGVGGHDGSVDAYGSVLRRLCWRANVCGNWCNVHSIPTIISTQKHTAHPSLLSYHNYDEGLTCSSRSYDVNNEVGVVVDMLVYNTIHITTRQLLRLLDPTTSGDGVVRPCESCVSTLVDDKRALKLRLVATLVSHEVSVDAPSFERVDLVMSDTVESTVSGLPSTSENASRKRRRTDEDAHDDVHICSDKSINTVSPSENASRESLSCAEIESHDVFLFVK